MAELLGFCLELLRVGDLLHLLLQQQFVLVESVYLIRHMGLQVQRKRLIKLREEVLDVKVGLLLRSLLL